jgi:hypothetical protein
MSVISGSVGADPATNAPEDVSTIQRMLNIVPPECGGPMTALSVSGTIDADTIAAITAFQEARYTSSDGRVDPRGRTLSDLNIYESAAADTNPQAAPPEVFCDVRVTGGPCGPEMMRRLRQVEAVLRQQSPRDQDFRSWCGILSVDGHQGRPSAIPIGKAVDLNANTNPYIVTRSFDGGVTKFGGERDGIPLTDAKRALIATIYDRAMAFAAPGNVADVGIRHPGETTGDVHVRFHRVSSSLSTYLSFAILPHGPFRLERPVIPNVETADYDMLLKTIPADGPLAERWDVETALQQIKEFLAQFPMLPPLPVSDLITGWHAQLLRDYELMRLPLVFGKPTPTPKATRNPVYGFMDLPNAVVQAMCDSGGLKWGACDLEIAGSGDMMHFQAP